MINLPEWWAPRTRSEARAMTRRAMRECLESGDRAAAAAENLLARVRADAGRPA